MTTTNRHLSASEEQGILVVSITLRQIVGYELAEAMGAELLDAARRRTANDVIVDLTQVEQMSSVGFGPFISLRSCVRETGGRLVLCGFSPTIHDLFKVTHLLINPSQPRSLFQFADTQSSAVAFLKST